MPLGYLPCCHALALISGSPRAGGATCPQTEPLTPRFSAADSRWTDSQGISNRSTSSTRLLIRVALGAYGYRVDSDSDGTKICAGRVAIVTGAGRGIGREHALMLASRGAAVVVNDVGVRPDGTGGDRTQAETVVAEIRAAGGRATASAADVSDWNAAKSMIDETIDTYGRLDVLVNNAGILRDRMLVNMSEADWDDVIRVHLKGTVAPSRHAAAYWRSQTKQGAPVDGRIINTTSVSGLYGHVAQTNYGSAKMGLANFTIVAAMELHRYGVTVNAIAPYAMTRLSESVLSEPPSLEQRHSDSPRWIAPICTWLASPLSGNVTGRVFQVQGDRLAIAESWHRGPTATNVESPEDLTAVIADLMANARPNADMNGDDAIGEGRPGRGI